MEVRLLTSDRVDWPQKLTIFFHHNGPNRTSAKSRYSGSEFMESCGGGYKVGSGEPVSGS